MPRDNPFEPMIKNIGNYVSGTLYGPGVIPPIGITNYDGTALASPADVHLLAAKDPVINEISVGMSGNLIGENTVTGAPPLQLPNSAGYPLQGLNVVLSPYQEGSGDPSPDNIRPIHGTDKVTLWTGGKNQFGPNLEIVSDAYIQQSGIQRNSNGWTISDYIPVTPLTQYTFTPNSTSGASAYFAFYKSDKALISTIKSETVTFTTPSDCYYMRFSYRNSSYNIQLEFGSTVSDYTPYVAPSSTDITLPNIVYGGTYDAVTGHGSITWTSVDMGTLEWTRVVNPALMGGGSFQTSLPDRLAGAIYQHMKCPIYVITNIRGVSNIPSTLENVIFANTLNTSIAIYVIDSAYADATAFKAAMQGVYLVYELATPIYFTTGGHSITLPQGDATIWATAEDGTVDSMEVTYVGKA